MPLIGSKEELKQWREYKANGGTLGFARWLDADKPGAEGALGKEGVEETEDDYGVFFGSEASDEATLPDGRVVSRNWWLGLSDEEKLKWAGAKVEDGKITFYGDPNIYDVNNMPEQEFASRSEMIEAAREHFKPTATTDFMNKHPMTWTDEEWRQVDDWRATTGQTREEFLSEMGFGGGEVGDDDYEKWSMGFQEKQFEWQRDEATRARTLAGQTEARQFQLEREEIQKDYYAQLTERINAPAQTEWQRAYSEQEAKAESWEAIKQEMLAELKTSPSDWFQYKKLEATPNKYKGVEQPPVEEIEKQYQGQIDYWQSELDRIEDEIADRDSPMYSSSDVYNVEQTLRDYIRRGKAQLAQIKSGTFFPPAEEDRSRYYQPAEAKLGIPSWLQGGIEGSPTETSFREPAQALTPSGQSWTRYNPAQKEMWGSYAVGAGQRPQDLLWGMQSSLPKNLNLGRTWKSFSQV